MKNKFTGGFRLGKGFSCINGTYPFAKLRLEDKIYLDIWFWIFKRTYVFELDEVLIKVGVLLFGDSMQIIHNKPNYPSHIYFHSFKLKDIALLLKAKGVSVEVQNKTLLQKVLKIAFKIYISIFLLVFAGGILFFLALLIARALGYI